MEDTAMTLELKSTCVEYELSDVSGYNFKIIAQQDSDKGWWADVMFSATGFRSAETAILHLIPAAEHFVRMLKEARDG